MTWTKGPDGQYKSDSKLERVEKPVTAAEEIAALRRQLDELARRVTELEGQRDASRY